MKHALNTDYESDAMILARAANIIRKDIFNSQGFHFSGSFPPGCQQESVLTNLKYFVSILLNGPNLQDQESTDLQACLTLSQMILFNFKKEHQTQVSLGTL